MGFVVNAEYPLSEIQHCMLLVMWILEKELVTLYIERLTGFQIQTICYTKQATYNGFQPTFETDIFDNLGIYRGKI
jgi:iron complex outermembrane receptor protein